MSGTGNWGWSAFELMADHTPCAAPCDVCDLFGPLTPERLARMRAQSQAGRAHPTTTRFVPTHSEEKAS